MELTTVVEHEDLGGGVTRTRGRLVRLVDWKHKQKMARKKRQRRVAGDRRTAAYERMKFLSPLLVRDARKWLKSPYAFRRGGL